MTSIISRAIAKVNLLLNITKKTDSGYHEMESIFVFLNDIYDELIFFPEVEFNNSSAQILGLEENSIQKAARILKLNFHKKIPHVIIKKNLPIAAGIGGGSSDSACFINTVFDIWKFSKKEKLKYINIFNELGADNMIFLHKYFCDYRFIYLNGTGINGNIEEVNLDLENCYTLIVNDGDSLSTKSVFHNFQGPFQKIIGIENINSSLLKNFHNSLQPVSIKLVPKLSKILNDLSKTKPLFCGVSGSGPTCFAIYKSKTEAEFVMRMLQYKFKMISRI